MAEEQACLVRARSDSESSSKLGSFGSITRTMTYTEDRLNEGAGEPASVNMATSPTDNVDGESGELLDYNDSSVLEQFHEDALRQAGCGLTQGRVLLATSLAVAGSSLELSAIPFILPSAEIELCILLHEKNWLVMISLVGVSLGAIGWGVLAERLGRRRTLLSCLAVNAVFASIAAFMPTYGTFMMARFCSSIGSGGVVATSFTYCGEVCPRASRWRSLPWLLCGLGSGAQAAATLASVVLPHTGGETLIENKEHFSAWHRYLLLCTLPILASLISLIWTQESPRYLLDVGREVDAMIVYQSMHSGNQFRLCSKAHVGAANPSGSDYRLGELALPGKRRPPALHHVRHSVKMFWQAFFQLFSGTYWMTTISLGGTLLFSTAILFYLSSYVPATVVNMENEAFEASRKVVENSTVTDENYNTTMENVRYKNVTFVNCTFRDMLMSHVGFENCSFTDVALSNIKSSYTSFESAVFVNSTIIDTDMEVGREFDPYCVFNSTVIRGMKGGCARHADLNWQLDGIIVEQSYTAQATLTAAVLALLPPRTRPTALLCAGCVLLSPSIYVAKSETVLYIVEAVYRVFLTLIFFNVSVSVVESYPANLRCTAHGLILSVTYMGGAIVRASGDGGAIFSCLICALLALSAAGLATGMR